MMQINRRCNRYRSRLQIVIGTILGGLASFLAPAHAQEMFDNNGIQFNVDTIVEFEFVKSHGAYQTTFGVVNLNTGEKTPLIAEKTPLLIEVKPSDIPEDVNRPSSFESDTADKSRKDFVGTPGNTVPKPLAEFEFKANTKYGFYLDSAYNGRPVGTVYSTNAQNFSEEVKARFEGGISGLSNGGTLIYWDDTGAALVRTREQQDRDFDDFIVRTGGHLTCPPNEIQ